jgi:two-component system vancomycin resistance associated response regulator VraR
MPCRVLIAEDQLVVRQLFENIIASSDDYQLAACIDTARTADSYCAAGNVDLVIMDVVMSDGSNGLLAAERIKKSYPKVKVMIVTSLPDALFLQRARQIGVDSFWYKEVQAIPMLEIMDRTMNGEHVFPDSPPVSRLGLASSDEFTERELEILRLLTEGMTDREIAESVHLSVTTVRYHVNNLLSKTGKNSRTELAVSAVQSGIAVPGIK